MPRSKRSSDLILNVDVECNGWRRITGLKKHAQEWLGVAIKSSGVRAEEICISIIFTDDDTIQKINRQWRGFNKPTNVLSFSNYSRKQLQKPDPVLMLGDIVLAYQTILAEARMQNKSLKDHTAHLLIHGLLHLLGYDHERKGDAREMESLEKKILKQFHIGNPYDYAMVEA